MIFINNINDVLGKYNLLIENLINIIANKYNIIRPGYIQNIDP